MEKFGVAIVGCGAIHGIHGDAVAGSEQADLLAVMDVNRDRARASGEKNGCRWYTDYAEILKDDAINVVHICTPHYLHAGLAREAVKAGKHVLIEKPVAISLSEARTLAKEAKTAGKFVGVCFQNRFNPTSVKAREMIVSGEFGAVKGVKGLVTWFRDEAYYTQSGWRGSFDTEGGGVLINQAIHTLDLMQWLGGGVSAVKGHTATRLLHEVIEVEDTADAALYFKNGARGVFYATNCYTDNSPIEVEVHCEKATFRIYNGELTMNQQGTVTRLVDENAAVSKYKSYWGKSHAILIEAFYQCIAAGETKGLISVEEGMESLRMIEGIYKSSATGNIIKL